MGNGNEGYLKPKVRVGKVGMREKMRGMFVNVPGYVVFGGLKGADKIPKPDGAVMSLEGSPTAQKGKPI